ncbi:Rrf2 family transcriptional regulator [Rhodocaloribacter litoris]|uniref:RrF2 family transcriptional regulator n=1 Tax=Rhodocaloribacter litoris TaxID=2558931 RepID=UPI001E2868D6|nr:Rrf2 family transcriptional regulator [Rhodocaloribacter litoris]QXD16121.1 Rrf2 family transcriptional regulator [Rhodocaloribacter litoris]
MLLSKSAEYGLRATLYLTALEPEGYVAIREISKELDISFHFLTKILQKLTEAGLIRSFRGPKGGVALARSPDRITLYDIVVAIDGPELFTECVLGLPGCGEHRLCPLHDAWRVERGRLQALLTGTTLATLAARIREEGLRLAPGAPVPPEA